jgi:putative ABC transport system permease protein
MYRARNQVNPTWPNGTGSPSTPGFGFVIHTTGDPHQVLGAVRRALAESAADQPVESLGTLEEHFNADGRADQNSAEVLAGFGGFGVLLCLIGIVGVVSETVTRRTREIGVRIALGAQWRDVISLVLHDACIVACAGVIVGLFVSALLARTAGHFLFAWGTGIDDPAVLFGAATSVLLVVLAATLWPAARALRVDPVIALRSE